MPWLPPFPFFHRLCSVLFFPFGYRPDQGRFLIRALYLFCIPWRDVVQVTYHMQDASLLPEVDLWRTGCV